MGSLDPIPGPGILVGRPAAAEPEIESRSREPVGRPYRRPRNVLDSWEPEPERIRDPIPSVYVPCRKSLMMASRAEMTSSQSTRDLLKRSWRLKALVGAR